jgi:hypothetical protein
LAALAALLLPGVARFVGSGILRCAAVVQQRWLLVVAAAMGCAALFYFARLRFQFLGDGQLWVDLIRQGDSFHHFEPLSSFLVTLVAKLVSRADPASAAGISSVLLGAVFVLLTAGLARSLWRQSASAALTWILLLWNPIALLWFGYVESYPLVLTLQVSLAWALVQGVRGRFPVWGVALIMAAANASHVLTLAWWPSLFVLMWWRQQRRIQGRPRLGGVLLRSVGLCAAVLAVVVAVWLLLRVDLGEIVQRLGSQRGIDSISGRWFVSRAHLFDVFNEVALLLAPALLLAIGSLVAGARLSMFPRSAEGSTLLGLLLGPLLTLLFVPPLLGGARDWDLYATVALPLILWSVQMWSQVQRPEPVAKRAKPAAKRTKPAARPVAEHGDVVLATRAIGLAAALTLGWVVVPLNAGRTTACTAR